MLPWLPWLVAAATAHPFGQDYWALRTELRMGATGPEIVVFGEVPIMVVLAEFRRFYQHLERPGVEEDQAYRERKLDELRQRLVVRVDEAPVAGRWVPVDSPRNGLAGEGSFLYMLSFESAAPWAIDGDRFEIAVSNGAYQDRPLWLSAHVGAQDGAGWAVADSTARDLLGAGADLEDVSQEPSGWTRDEQLRTLDAVFERVPTQPVPAPHGGGCGCACSALHPACRGTWLPLLLSGLLLRSRRDRADRDFVKHR